MTEVPHALKGRIHPLIQQIARDLVLIDRHGHQEGCLQGDVRPGVDVGARLDKQPDGTPVQAAASPIPTIPDTATEAVARRMDVARRMPYAS